MLEEKIVEESKRASRGALQVGAIFVVSAGLVALFLLDIIRINFENLGISSNTATLQSNTSMKPPVRVELPEPHTEAVVHGDAGVSAPHLKSAPSSQVMETLDNIRPTTAPLSITVSSDAAKRHKFKEKVRAFDRQYRDEVVTELFGSWHKLAKETILANYDRALSAFAAANYDVAIAAIDAAAVDAANELEARAVAFELALSEAGSAYSNDDVDLAEINIDRALQIDPDSPAALNIKAAIEKLPEIQDLQKRASIARLENNLEREAVLLRGVLELDSKRSEIEDRLNHVVAAIAEMKFLQAIDNGVHAVEKRDLRGAANALEVAEDLYKLREEANLLRKQVALLRVEVEVEALIGRGMEASRQDKWVQAFKHFSNAAEKLPGSKDAIDGKTLSSTLLDFHARLDRHLAAPERLSASNVAQELRGIIDEAIVYKAFSPSLVGKVSSLEQSLSAYSSQVPVWVVSDGNTQVSVRGVGRIGKTTGRTIKLKPGTYLFEGKRLGYRSKIVEFKVLEGNGQVTVEVVCDERV